MKSSVSHSLVHRSNLQLLEARKRCNGNAINKHLIRKALQISYRLVLQEREDIGLRGGTQNARFRIAEMRPLWKQRNTRMQKRNTAILGSVDKEASNVLQSNIRIREFFGGYECYREFRNIS